MAIFVLHFYALLSKIMVFTAFINFLCLSETIKYFRKQKKMSEKV